MGLLQLPQPLQWGLQGQVQLVAGAEQVQQVAGAPGAARAVHQLPGRGQPVRPELKPLALSREETRCDVPRKPEDRISQALCWGLSCFCPATRFLLGVWVGEGPQGSCNPAPTALGRGRWTPWAHGRVGPSSSACTQDPPSLPPAQRQAQPRASAASSSPPFIVPTQEPEVLLVTRARTPSLAGGHFQGAGPSPRGTLPRPRAMPAPPGP